MSICSTRRILAVLVFEPCALALVTMLMRKDGRIHVGDVDTYPVAQCNMWNVRFYFIAISLNTSAILILKMIIMKIEACDLLFYCVSYAILDRPLDDLH